MRTVSVLFFLSGAVGLLYEVLWAKHLAVALGSTAMAQTFVLAVFLGGLALGNAFFGRQADRSPDPLLLYGKLELAAGLLAAGSPLFLRWIERLPWGAAAAAGAACVLAPSVLLGGTLPALSRWIIPSLDRMRAGVSWLYFLNSAGAVAGALTAGFLLIPRLGLDIPILLGAAVNLGIGAAAMMLAKRLPAPRDPGGRPATRDPEPAGTVAPPVMYAAVFLSGLVSLSYEIGWIRLLALALGSSTYAFSLMLGAFIAGIALGSFLVSRRALLSWDPALLFALAEFGVVASILLTWPFYERLPFYALLATGAVARTPAAFHLISGLQLLLCFLLMLLPTAFLGATLPLASRAAGRSASRIGTTVGAVFAFNTAGNVLGAFAAGILLLPLLGIKGLFQAGLLVNLLVGGLVLWRAVEGPEAPLRARRRRWSLAAGGCAALLFAMHAAFSDPLDRLVLSSGTFRHNSPPVAGYGAFRAALRGKETLFYRDDREGTVTVERTESGTLHLKVNGKTDASTGEDMATQSLLAHLPLTLNPGAEDVLIIGLGSGITAGAALTHPIKRLDVVEISKAVVDAERFFRPHNHDPLSDRRLTLHVDDAKTFLRRTDRRYDSIVSEPSNPWIAGMGNLFSIEFYREARAKLKPGGVMVQWFHLYEMSDDILRLVLRTFSAAFRHATLWNVSSNDILLIGSDSPLSPAPSAMETALRRPEAAEDLRRIGIGSPATLLSLQSASDRAVRRAAGQGPLNKDRFPVLEYRAPLALFLNKTSALAGDMDERRSPTTGVRLMLTRYLMARKAPLSKEELRGFASFHGRYGGPVHRAILGEWRSRYADEPL